jgi:hypothetical protein
MISKVTKNKICENALTCKGLSKHKMLLALNLISLVTKLFCSKMWVPFPKMNENVQTIEFLGKMMCLLWHFSLVRY